MTIQFKEQTKIGKILSRSKMIFYEFFEKWYFYSFKLAVYNSMWWIGNYCHPLVKLQFLAKHKMTTYMDNLLEMSVLPPPPPHATHAHYANPQLHLSPHSAVIVIRPTTHSQYINPICKELYPATIIRYGFSGGKAFASTY